MGNTKSQFGPFVIDVGERVLQRDGVAVPLTPKAFDLLATFVERPGRLLTKEELLQAVWPGTFVEESNLAYNVFALRRALGDTADGGLIETVPKHGYRFTAVVSPVTGNPTDPARGPSRHVARWVVLAAAAVAVIGVTIAVRIARTGTAAESPIALPLTSLPGAVRSPSLSPDGNFVVFSWTGPRQDNPDLYVQQVSGGMPVRLTTDPGNDFSPSWSPDGRTIAFLRRQTGGSVTEVRTVPPLGGPERKIADTKPLMPQYRPLSVGWCPNARCVVVTDSSGAGGPDAVFAIALDTGDRSQMTFQAGQGLDADPIVSPDGRSLVFRRDTTPFSGAYYRQPLSDGAPVGDPVPLTEVTNGGKAAWTPEGREIVFGARGALWRLDAMKGGTPSRLASVGQDGVGPVVARMADGRLRLVYVRTFADGNVHRLELPAAGAVAPAAPVVAVASTRMDSIPNLSADGRRLAFVSDRTGELHLWIADPDGANAMQLTTPSTFDAGPGYPRWFPDGSGLVFHGDPAGRPDVIAVPAAGGKPRLLTAALPNGGYPSVSRDGRWVYFTVLRNSEPRIWKVPAGGGHAIQVTNNPGTLSIESYDGRELYYVSSSNRPASLWRQPLAGGDNERLVDGVIDGNFDVVDRGLYYIDRAAGESGTFPTDRVSGATRLRYFDFATRRSTTVAHDLGAVGSGISASRDGRTVYFWRVDSSVDELMVVDDFR